MSEFETINVEQDAIQEAFAIQDASICWLDIAESAVMRVLEKRPRGEPKDLLNDTLKLIGLETNQFFRVNDYEFIGNNYYIDSFGDVYVVSGRPDKFPEEREPENDQIYEYLTLGRLLTQYEDKIVPWDIEDVGYA